MLLVIVPLGPPHYALGAHEELHTLSTGSKDNDALKVAFIDHV